MTRTAGYFVLACLVIAGAAFAGFVVARDDVLVLPPDLDGPIANRDGKTDRLPVAFAALPATSPTNPSVAITSPIDTLRQAYASESPLAHSDLDFPGPARDPIARPPLPQPRPRAANLPPPQTAYTLLSDIQIAGIKERLQLSESQAKYWPPVEQALRAVAQRMHVERQASPTKGAVSLGNPERQQLQTAAAPLLAKLREDQKREIRALARIIGLDAIASRI